MADVNKTSVDGIVYALIANIPSFYHSSDLRNYFSQFLESGGFDCFHFRHRPEVVRTRAAVPLNSTSNNDKNDPTSDVCKESESSKLKRKSESSTRSCKSTCCVIRLRKSKLEELMKMYNRKCWLDKKGDSIRSVCCISKIKTADCADDDNGSKFRTRAEARKIPVSRESFSCTDLLSLPELHPPALMPQGNIGTPTSHFLHLIQQCRLPASIISKLGLVFPRTRSNRRYGNVPLSYGTEVCKPADDDNFAVSSARGSEIISEKVMNSLDSVRHRQAAKPPESTLDEESKDNEESESDADECEEWERHEAFHNDPSNQERNTERLYESEMEIVWEKGGPGIVWYTDAQFWSELEGTEEEKDVDEWDIDMSVYYDADGGDKDARDMAVLRRDARRRKGRTDDESFESAIGKFEKHSKGVGRKVMKKYGWQEGQSLGSSVRGIVDALDAEGGQKPSDKRGLGYRGEKLQIFGGPSAPKKPKRRSTDLPIISTIYDDPEVTDPQEPLLRRLEPTHLKYRSGIQFRKSSSKD